jgi:long-chain acyl-CoA synthetase
MLLKPTVFASVPRIFNRVYSAINAKIAELGFVKRKLSELALRTKLRNLNS